VSTELKDLILARPISSIIGHYIPLSLKGQNYWGVCPFHSDTKPSMSVNDKKGMFKCFSCEAAGNSFTFVEKFKKISFKEALKEIAQISGLNYQDYVREAKVSPEKIMAKKILSKALQIYTKLAVDPVFKKFLVDRGLNDKTAEQFALGYAPNQNIIAPYLNSIPDENERKFALKIALDVGIIRSQKNSEGHYDTFRDRIMFPIWDRHGTVVGFGGRALDPNALAKYLNSQESFFFYKKNILYGAHLAEGAIRESGKVILVEGYMDLIALHQAGFSNSVAVMGIGLGEHTLQFLKGLTHNFYLALDSDTAGLNAMNRINALLLEQGIIAKYLDFTPQKDPDEFIKVQGSLPLHDKINEAKNFLDINLDNLVPKIIPELPDQKLTLLRSAFQLLGPLGNRLETTERLVRFAEKIALRSDNTQIQQAFQAYLSQKISPQKSIISTPVVKTEIAPEENNIVIESKVYATSSRGELMMIGEIINHPGCLSHEAIDEILAFCTSDEVKIFVTKLRALYFEIDESEWSRVLNDLMLNGDWSLTLREKVGSTLFQYQPQKLESKAINRLMRDLRKKLEQELLKTKRFAIKEQQQNATSSEELDRFMLEIMNVDKKMDLLKLVKKIDVATTSKRE
jgi:DNA primase